MGGTLGSAAKPGVLVASRVKTDKPTSAVSGRFMAALLQREGFVIRFYEFQCSDSITTSTEEYR
jgi:hypothetical protein